MNPPLRRYLVLQLALFIFGIFGSQSLLANSDTTYTENTVLQVIQQNDHLVFVANGSKLFDLPKWETLNFLQVAKDLESFDNRIKSVEQIIKITASVYLGMGTVGLIRNLISVSAVSALPGLEKDRSVERLANNDLRYFFSDPKFLDDQPLTKVDVLGLTQGLKKVQTEYLRRMEKLLAFERAIENQSVSCDPDKLGFKSSSSVLLPYISVSEIAGRDQDLIFEVQFSEQESEALLDESIDWMDQEKELRDAKITFSRKTLAIKYFELKGKKISLSHILSTIGIQTRQVNTKHILRSRFLLRTVYLWSTLIRQCLLQTE
ncbi:MAG: hypothetical protein KDD61_14825 [Bdellovibrionales bacterium]|nr:hypothetical protein [Bdellovibrionales bacterium]